ncbi:MAG TPA: GAF domain-containing protein [Xanthobacteraceae bacterium]|nr:GAF domain-containing protein [Xanthobacteraceae bacterium]
MPKAVAVLARERDHLLEQQTAIADLLGIISRSKFELLPVLQTVVDTAVRLCRATSGEIFGLDKGVYRFAVGCNLDPAYVRRQKPIAPGPGTMVGRTALARQVAKIDDLLADPSYALKEDAKIGGARSMIGVPLMREGEPIGVIILARHRVEPFVETDINLVKAFADKAVIAITVLEREGQLARQARSAEQALELLAGVSKAASTAIDLRALALDCLVQSAQSAGCQFGQLWYPEPGAHAIKCVPNSYFGDRRFADFHLFSVEQEPQRGDNSIPGWIWQNRAPLWIEDLATRDDLLGVEKARAAGFRSCLSGPILIDEDVFAIFEMYSTNFLPFDQTIMAAVVKLGTLLGDILVRKRSELALRAAHSELARVSQLSAMGAMTASIGHEIRQPLAAVVIGAHAGLRWMSKSPPDLDEVSQALKSIIKEGQRTSDILDAIRAMFKKDDQEIAPVDINHLVRDVLDLVQSEAQQQGVLVKAELADELPQIFGNRIQLQQVIRNLAINAIEAMDINAERERVLRVKSAIDRPNGLLITVEDTGTGIDPQNVERVFDAMFTTKSDGMGMGLSICRSIIEAHHGRLWVSPGVPHGAVFQFVLPITRA